MIDLDEDKELATLLTGYQDMVGLLNVQKVAQINTQVVQNFALPKSKTDWIFAWSWYKSYRFC